MQGTIRQMMIPNARPHKVQKPINTKAQFVAKNEAIQYADWNERFGARASPRDVLIY